MRVAVFVAAAGILAGSSGVALAQSAPDKIGETSSYWTATGFVGSSFSTHSLISDATDNGSSLAWGGEAAYLWHGIIGPEALVDFGPNVGITSASLSRDPHLNSYMANAIGSLPLGTRGNVQPYVSGGYGAVQLKADIIGPIATPADA